MPSPAFDAAMPFILRWEGGFVDHPKDPGGRTNKGVTQRVYTAWRARRGLPQQDVKFITDGEVKEIYEGDYWLPPRCNQLPTKLDLVQFDTAVNMGVGRAVRILQGAVGCGVDGQFGPGTAQAVARCEPRTRGRRLLRRPRGLLPPPRGREAGPQGLPQGLAQPAQLAAQGSRPARVRLHRAVEPRRSRADDADSRSRRGPGFRHLTRIAASQNNDAPQCGASSGASGGASGQSRARRRAKTIPSRPRPSRASEPGSGSSRSPSES